LREYSREYVVVEIDCEQSVGDMMIWNSFFF
jgi:hypothetical protein